MQQRKIQNLQLVGSKIIMNFKYKNRDTGVIPVIMKLKTVVEVVVEIYRRHFL